MSFRASPDPGFFVGYFKKVPEALRRFVLGAAVVLVAGFAALAVVLSLATDDPGPGGYVGDGNSVPVAGVLELKPYPLLRMPATANRPAHALMLAGEGKEGVEAPAALAGKLIDTAGVLLKRGDLEMMLVTDPIRPATISQGAPVSPVAAPIGQGHWRLSGEICDGKCYSGAMKPGNGLAHKACANLCLIGGVPPVLVTQSPVNGASFFLLADAAGGPLGPEILQSTAVPVSIDGALEMRDDLPVFRIDPASIRRLP